MFRMGDYSCVGRYGVSFQLCILESQGRARYRRISCGLTGVVGDGREYVGQTNAERDRKSPMKGFRPSTTTARRTVTGDTHT